MIKTLKARRHIAMLNANPSGLTCDSSQYFLAIICFSSQATEYRAMTHPYLLANSLTVRTDAGEAWKGVTEKGTDVDEGPFSRPPSNGKPSDYSASCLPRSKAISRIGFDVCKSGSAALMLGGKSSIEAYPFGHTHLKSNTKNRSWQSSKHRGRPDQRISLLLKFGYSCWCV